MQQKILSKLEMEIAEKQRQLAEMKKLMATSQRQDAIKDLSEFTDLEKVKIFDKLYSSAISVVADAEKKGYVNDDDPHYMYEELMGILARDKKRFWEYFNSLQN